MDVKLQNAYVEVLLDNFMAVVKQNVMFQAQIEVMKQNVQESEEVKRKIDELSERNVELQKVNNEINSKLESYSQENNTLKSTVGQKDNQINRYTDTTKERDRLQTAVNSYMRQVKSLEDELKQTKSTSQEHLIKLSSRLEDLNKYVEVLELSLPANKLKKIKSENSKNLHQKEVVTQQENTEPRTEKTIVKSGGSF